MIVQRPKAEYKSVYLNEAVSLFSIVVSKGDINKVLALYNLDHKLHAFFHSVNRHVLKT
jgi:hypothetical protein